MPEPTPLLLDDNTVEVWVVDLKASHESIEHAFQLLSDDERHRAEQFRFPMHRNRFVIARASLRRILASYLQIEPAQLVFRYSEYGKPSLVTPESDLRFNASRSDEKALVACSRGRELGVDNEKIRQDLDVDDLARHFFTVSENDRLRLVPPEFRHLGFLRCWTCKEALAKAIGGGLSLNLERLDVSAALSSPSAILSTDPEEFTINEWSLITFGIAAVEGHVSALVTRGAEPPNVSIQPWPK